MLKSHKLRASALVSTALVAGSLAFAGSAQAAQIGDLCQVGNPNGAFITSGGTSGGVSYWTIPYGAYWRVESYNTPTTYKGHDAQGRNGSIARSDINQATCH